ncbi:MAG TPA: hypothetical protein VKL19_12630 [Thermoanaerobaculia bacterium]|nr:hypothetical protein [Thermoanaerobaculia bacterium]
MRRALLVIAMFVPFVALAAEEAKQASGTFEGTKVKFNVKGAYAYWTRSGDEPLIEVAVSNSGFKPAFFDSFYDPRPVIDTLFVDEETGVVYFQFEPNGKYHGMSYYLTSGDGCGFCYDPKVKSTVKITAQRADGKLSFKDENRSFDIQLDVPIAPKEWGKPIAGDGGDIGKAYRAYNTAMQNDDRKAIFKLLDSGNRESWTKQEKKGKLDSYLDYLSDKVHWRLKEARIVGGYVRENQAVLLIKGSGPVIDHVKGQVTLTRENDGWKISDEVYQVGE